MVPREFKTTHNRVFREQDTVIHQVPHGFYQRCLFATLLDVYDNGTALILLFKQFRAHKYDNGLRELPLRELSKQYE